MNKIILYGILGLLVLGLLVMTFFPGITQALLDSGKTGSDKCDIKPGYTEESWRDHMSHHPDIYKECLT